MLLCCKLDRATDGLWIARRSVNTCLFFKLSFGCKSFAPIAAKLYHCHPVLNETVEASHLADERREGRKGGKEVV